MADELDLLQEQDELLNQLHIQAARQRSCLQGKSRNRCECCGNRIPLRRQQAIPGVQTCTECQRAFEIRQKQYLR
ncbi:TraR/DksA C4-type zinc finger protein [Enterobacter hormaechei]|uniref:TraR/DksA C4-type zinc finger protein n=1 Tax=Enterobacter cloacae complex TaxID=354276 RepID=UPI00128142EB|nr:conjugal transfer protein TraR [Salmonella enterica]EIH6078480.1 TraR/DksA C4-type zinc finger protein [Escherichia coli]HDU4042334.1 TraR/DksA C4-type zinc finger protein [Klebsiella aerogenes]HDU4054202.1 TraR/DksA C4-type zinc finger protein [Klebsiella aerogenes]